MNINKYIYPNLFKSTIYKYHCKHRCNFLGEIRRKNKWIKEILKNFKKFKKISKKGLQNEKVSAIIVKLSQESEERMKTTKKLLKKLKKGVDIQKELWYNNRVAYESDTKSTQKNFKKSLKKGLTKTKSYDIIAKHLRNTYKK